MPEKRTLEKAKQDLDQGKSPTTAAGEFVREEIEHIRRGKHGARSTKQAIAIGLSKARQAGVPLRPAPGPAKAKATPARKRTSHQAAPISGAGKKRKKKLEARSSKRGAAALAALKREPRSVVSRAALSRQAKTSAARRKRSTRSQAGKPKQRAAHTSARSSETTR
jgi:hypothetical protein